MGGFASLLSRVLLVAALLLSAAAVTRAQERVGVNTAVNPDATGTPPGAAPRKLVIGQDVIFNEHITTGGNGQTQLLFLDESAMTVGPNSDLTIDQFVYDPKSGTGKLAMSATRGLLRYVGGKLSKQDNAVTMHTTTATLAVRGGAFMLDVGPSCGAGGQSASARCGTAEAIFIFGDGLSVTGRNGVTETLLRPGYAITIGAGGQLSAPFAVPPQTLAAFLQELNGRQGGSGGATVVPTDAVVVASGLPTTIEGIAPPVPATTLAAAQQILLQTSNSSQTFNPQPNSAGQIVTTCTSQSCSSNFATPVNQSSPAPTPAGGFAGRVKNTNGKGTATGFVDQSANGDAPYSAGALSNGKFTAQIGGSLGTISFPLAPGTSSFGPNNTSSGLGSLTGSSFLSSDGTFFYASLTPTNQPTERLFITGGTAVQSAFYAPTGSTRLFAFTIQPDAALGSNIPFVRPQAGGNLVNAAVSPLYVVAPPATRIGDASTAAAARALQGSLAIDGVGANQRSTIAVSTGTIDTLQSSGLPILNGVMRGSSLQGASGTPVRLGSAVSSMVDANGNSFYGASTVTGFGLDQTAFSGTANLGTVGAPVIPSTASEVPLTGAATNYGFAQAATAAAAPSGVGASRTTQTLSGNFGGLMYTTAQATPYILTGGATISADAAGNRIQATLSGAAQPSSSAGVSTVTMQYGGLTGDAGGREAFVDDKTFAALESQVNPQQINGQTLVVKGDPTQAGKLYLASSGVATPPASLLPAGASYCQCQYLQWGYWGGDLLTGNSTDSTISRIDRGHINTWVAGVPTPLSDLNSLESISAQASYTGHAFGSVYNNGASYVAAGGFNGAYNFGTQIGSFTISNFDGHTFTGAGKVPLNGANYTFAVSGAGFQGGGNGTFYGPGAAETGGSFGVQSTVGPKYIASGIYAGKQ